MFIWYRLNICVQRWAHLYISILIVFNYTLIRIRYIKWIHKHTYLFSVNAHYKTTISYYRRWYVEILMYTNNKSMWTNASGYNHKNVFFCQNKYSTYDVCIKSNSTFEVTRLNNKRTIINYMHAFKW